MKPVLLALLLPPANLPIFAVAGLLVRRWHRRPGAAMTAASCVLLIVLSMPIVGGTMLVALEQGAELHSNPSGKPASIVILSAGIARLGGDDAGFGPDRLSLERERAGAMLFRRVQLPVLIAGGVLRSGDPPISVVMEQSMRNDFQVPVRWTERTSRDTWENAEYAAKILRENGIRTVYLVTHAWHMRRALIAFRHFGIEAIPAPVQIDRYPDFATPFLVPSVSAWQSSYLAIHEWLGCAYYALR